MPSSELIEFAVALLIAGGCGGILAGLFGVGGGIITVPVLFTVLKMLHVPEDIAIHLAVGTSLMTIIPGSISSSRAHRKRGAIDNAVVKNWGPFIAIGAVLGGLMANHMSGPALTLTFGIFSVFIAFLMAAGPKKMRVAKAAPKMIVQRMVAGIIGFTSALVGVGGGSLSVPTMVLWNAPIHRAVGTASLLGLCIALPGAIVFLLTPTGSSHVPPGTVGTVNLIAFALLAPATMLAAPQGAKLAHKLSPIMLRRAFAVFLCAIAAKMIVNALT